MIRALLVFADSGLPYYQNKVPVAGREKDIDDTLVSSLLTALAIFAKEVVDDEISKIDLKAHQILFQKWTFFTEDHSEPLTFAMVCKDIDFSNQFSLARLQGLLVRLMLRYQSRFNHHMPNVGFTDENFDEYVREEIPALEKKLGERPYPQISIHFHAENVQMWEYSPRLKETLSLVWNKLFPAFSRDCSIEFGENHAIFHYGGRGDLEGVFIDETWPNAPDMVQVCKPFFSAGKSEAATICFHFLKVPDKETLRFCLNKIKRFYLFGQVRNESDIAVKEAEKSIYITVPTFQIYVASIELACKMANQFLKLQ